ncbi:hypothetical protein CPHO_01440 [Corynebacterium phocae]|uniref:ABC transporter domain-containing protein n=1 Tax=Corynebacterium phocae TaxID=161895 RepID=A0A1L7D6C4_9CORY|nr:hypothetical protein CPHO_01440 [Corynebacterium phocae]
MEIRGVTLTAGKKDIVKDVSFGVRRGRITLLAGPNGAGKSTLLSIVCGLLEQSSGDAEVFGQRYTDMSDPIFRVGTFLSAEWLDAGRSARNNLKILAQSAGIDSARVEEVIELCGLSSAADRLVKGFSLGMRQRCGIAAALLGDPELLILDEPVNGLDPLGMAWMRELLVKHRDNGGTVLLSSHLLRDAEDICDDLVVLAHGEVMWEGPLADFGGEVEICTEFASDRWAEIVQELGVEAESLPGDVVSVPVEPKLVSQAARRCGADLSYLVPKKGSLEESFQALVNGKDSIR